MGKSRNLKHNANPPRSAVAPRRFPRWATPVLALIVVAAIGLWWGQGRRANTPPAPTTGVGFEKLKGRWQRPDGGYIVDVRNVGPDGKMDVAYFNPHPINVARAEAAQDGAVTTVFIELRDLNYPGSIYKLAYQADTDQLTGIYYQAALQQQFEVIFLRME